MYTFLCKSRKARDHLWEKGEALRKEGIAMYNKTLDRLVSISGETKKEKTLMKRFSKHREKILTFMNYEDVPPDNNGSEQAIRKSKVKMKVYPSSMRM